MKIFKTIVNLIIGLSGLGVIIHLVRKNEELNIQRESAESTAEFWKLAFKNESRIRFGHAFDIFEWKRLYREYGWGGEVAWWDRSITDRLMKEDDEKAEDLTKEK